MENNTTNNLKGYKPLVVLNQDIPTRGKAYVLDFVTPQGRKVEVFAGRSVVRFDMGLLWVADWILKQSEGVSVALKQQWRPTFGVWIDQTEAPVPEVPQRVENPAPKPTSEPSKVTKGFFTVNLPEVGKHMTFRIKTRNNYTKIGLMTGSNNLSDYGWFGRVENNAITFWKKMYDRDGIAWEFTYPQEILKLAFEHILGNTDSAGMNFARMYKQCRCCGKVLTTNESLDSGMGPVCENRETKKKRLAKGA